MSEECPLCGETPVCVACGLCRECHELHAHMAGWGVRVIQVAMEGQE
jgi:hypothetical protein